MPKNFTATIIDMESIDNKHNEFFKNSPLGSTCLLAEILFFKGFCDSAEKAAICPAPITSWKMSEKSFKEPTVLLFDVWHILCTIVPTVVYFALARIATQPFSSKIPADSVVRFLIEFLIITVPTIFDINVVNNKVEFIVGLLTVIIGFLAWRSKSITKGRERTFLIGKRPRMLTLGRSTINFLTAFCILAIDFDTFPREFRKTRRYGAGLMDTGIGLFVFAMGSVSSRPQRKNDLKRMLRIVGILVLLGVARTVVILAIDYSQDSHEYGKHLNAFFTLGFTKLLGTFFSAIARKNEDLLPIGLGVLALHEVVLQLGVADFVMNDEIRRDNFLRANKEGICSLPGFVALFILSMYLGHVFQTTDATVKFKEFMIKMKNMSFICLASWCATIFCIYSVSIARVTCNFGYVAWTLGIASFVILLYMIVFDLILDTILPIDKPSSAILDGGEAAILLKSNKSNNAADSSFAMPNLVQAVNSNGLVFFLAANILTGGVNIFLQPKNRYDYEGYIILCMYMLLSTSIVYILFRRNLRLG